MDIDSVLRDLSDQVGAEVTAETFRPLIWLLQFWKESLPPFAAMWERIQDPPEVTIVLDWTRRPDPPAMTVPARARELAEQAATLSEPIREAIRSRVDDLSSRLLVIFLNQLASGGPVMSSTGGPLDDPQFDFVHHFVMQHMDQLGEEFVEGCRQIRILLKQLFDVSALLNSSSVSMHRMREGDELPFKVGRIYLDVTDASLADVQEYWTLVDLVQKHFTPTTKKRRPGRQPGPMSDTVKHWIARAHEVGEAAARAEYEAEGSKAPGERYARYQWWYRHVKRRLRNS